MNRFLAPLLAALIVCSPAAAQSAHELLVGDSSNINPRYLLQLQASQRHAVVVDTRRSRLYLYENVDGQPRFVADYYVSHGRLGIEKMREGDKKTPLGVYQVTGFLPPERLTDFYGAGALPINYPNAWDRKQGRKGHGIWLHGTPSDTFSRPPRASASRLPNSASSIRCSTRNCWSIWSARPDPAFEDRLKAALKANMARRKAQAKARGVDTATSDTKGED